MSPELLDEAVVCLMILAGYMGILCIGCLIADYVFPRIPLIERRFEILPAWEDGDDSLKKYPELTEEQRNWLVEKLDKERRWQQYERS